MAPLGALGLLGHANCYTEWSRCSLMLADTPYLLAHCSPLLQTTSSTEHGAAKASVASAPAMHSTSARQESWVIFLTGLPPLFLVWLIKHSMRTVLLRRGAALDDKCFSLFLKFDSIKQWTNTSQGLRNLKYFDFGKVCLFGTVFSRHLFFGYIKYTPEW